MITIPQKLKRGIVSFYKRFVFKLSAENHPLFRGYYKYVYRPKKGSLAEFTHLFSKRYSPLTVVQVGANDGINQDPIHKFIKRDKWKGVLLEPQKEVFEKYLKKLHAKSDEIIPVNAALDYKNGTRTIYRIAFSNARWATGLTSFDRKTLEKAIESDYVKICARNEGLKIPAVYKERIREETIVTISPETLITKYQIKKIDWLQIDTEGFDFNIIKMFNIGKIRPKVIVFEHYRLSDTERIECYNHLKEHSYKIKEYGRDTLAILEPTEEFELFL